MQTKKLNNLVEIISGYTFREALKNDENGNIRVILAKNITESGKIDYCSLPTILMIDPKTKAFVQKDDVIFSIRGIFRAGVYTKSDNNVIASSSVDVLRIKIDIILPAFLVIYLNSELGQNSIRKMFTGSTIKTILSKDLAELLIPIPSLEEQTKVIAIYGNFQKRERLFTQKLSLVKILQILLLINL